MFVRWVLLAMTVLGASEARAEAAPTVRPLFEGVWKRAQCNQEIEGSLNSATYHELGGGYSLGMVLCWLEPHWSSQILFLVAPKTGGRPELLQFQHWRDNKFRSTDTLSVAEYHPKTRTVTSYVRYSGGGVCGVAAGEWTWTGTEFTLTGYWDNPDCREYSEIDRSDRFRVFPPKK
jgi:hypothetical protein